MTFSNSSSGAHENQLLVLCARTKVDSKTVATIRELATKPLDWEWFLRQAEEHSIVPLVERSLRKAGAPVPAQCAAKLETMTRENAMRCVALCAELIRVMDLFESRGIPAAPYKGPVIAAQAYGDITARQFEDLDIVLAQRDIAAADAAVRSLGYEARFPWIQASDAARRIVPGEYNYSHPARRTFVELHTELTLRHFPVRPDLGQFFQRAVKVDLGGHEVPSFCAEDALLMLCVHGAKDFWERLVWIADVAELVRSHPALDWDLVVRSSEEVHARRMLHLGLGLAAGILDTELPAEIHAAMKADSRAMKMAAAIEGRLLRRDAPQQSAGERFRFRRGMVEGTLRGCLYSMRLMLAPAEEDWQNARLPRRLTPLYAALRPFRLLRKYGWMNRT